MLLGAEETEMNKLLLQLSKSLPSVREMDAQTMPHGIYGVISAETAI